LDRKADEFGTWPTWVGGLSTFGGVDWDLPSTSNDGSCLGIEKEPIIALTKSGMHVTEKGFALASSRLKLISLVWRDLLCLRIGYVVAFIVIKKSKIASEVKTIR
jgi:hypothetical protein